MGLMISPILGASTVAIGQPSFRRFMNLGSNREARRLTGDWLAPTGPLSDVDE